MQEEERRRISQELHDDLGQRLALLEINISQLEQRPLPRDVRDGLTSARELIAELDKDIHRICYQLYPVVLEKLGLVVALRSLCQEFSQMTGVSVTFNTNAPKDIPANLSLCLYRITQEALHNVGKHAQAKEAKVSLREIVDRLEVVVTDSGIGFDPFLSRQRSGFGLIAIEERVKNAGGHCSIKSSPCEGTEVKAVVYRTLQNYNAEKAC